MTHKRMRTKGEKAGFRMGRIARLGLNIPGLRKERERPDHPLGVRFTAAVSILPQPDSVVEALDPHPSRSQRTADMQCELPLDLWRGRGRALIQDGPMSSLGCRAQRHDDR